MYIIMCETGIGYIPNCTVTIMQIESTILMVTTVAPHDKQIQCTKTDSPTDPGHGLVGAYMNTQKPLMDSYWYSQLTGSNGVWHFILGNVGDTGVSA